MPPTTVVLTAPEQGTVIRPVYVYSEEQTTQIEALREVSRLLHCQIDET